MFTADDVPDFDAAGISDVPMPAALAALVRTMEDIETSYTEKFREWSDAISSDADASFSSLPGIETLNFEPPEVAYLSEIRDLQADQSEAIVSMAEGIKQLALQAQREDRRTWALIGLTVLIAVLTAALLVATVVG
jgi:hypothetical protein